MLTIEEKQRMRTIDKLFLKNFKTEPKYHFKSTGRLEILGNHLDHNSGMCLVSSVDNLNIFAAVEKNNTNSINLYSEGYKEIVIDLSDLKPRKKEQGKSASFVRGISAKFKELGYRVEGFNAVVDSNIYKGAGISSSAAYSVLVCKIISYLYNDNKIDDITIAKISRFAENEYFGKKSGLLDQIGCCSKGFSLVDFKDQENPQVVQVVPKLDNYDIFLVNSNTSHAGCNDAYSSIPNDMKYIASLFGKKYLREVDSKDFYTEFDKMELKSKPWLRAKHFFTENARVIEAYTAIKNDDLKTFFMDVNESGLSSENDLQNVLLDNETTNNYLVALHEARKIIKDGAVRVHGGGFGGTIIAFVNKKESEGFVAHMSTIFGQDAVKIVSTCNDPLRLISIDEVE